MLVRYLMIYKIKLPKMILLYCSAKSFHELLKMEK